MTREEEIKELETHIKDLQKRDINDPRVREKIYEIDRKLAILRSGSK